MKSFLTFFTEARTSQASDQAARKGWTGDGHGNWFDKKGVLVARTESGRLVEIQRKAAAAPEEEQPKQKAAEPTEAEAKASQADLTAQAEGEFGMFPDGTPRTMAPPTRADGTPKEDKGPVTVAFGRFNPPTIGHQKLFDAAKKAAGKGALRIYPSRTQDAKKNPLDSDAKHKVLQQMFPDHSENIINDPNSKTIFDVLKQAYEDGHSSVQIVVGGDRQSEFEKLSQEYNGKLYQFSTIETISAGDRDEKKGGAEGMSASKMRKAATSKDEKEGFEEFKKGLPKPFLKDEEAAKQLFNTVRKQMMVKKEGWNLWEIAPKLDWKNLRENYIKENIFKIGQLVENLNTGVVGKIIRRGTSYLICVTEDNMMFKSWIKDLQEYTEVKMDSIEREPGKPNTLVGTAGYKKYVEKMSPGNQWGRQFINKYKKKSK
tara:strand:+ start:333 stop:1622 length:1290 start_codon:yes stop_codon:yes gene_type:complete